MPTADGLSAYLESLPAQRRERFASLSNLVSAIGVPESIESFVFLPGQTQHPRFDDAADVFWHAVERLYLSDAASDGELPLVYWGFHSYDILLRRSANGILLTDRTAYLVDVGRSSARLPLARIDPGTIVADAGGLHVGDAVVTLDGVARLLDATSAADSAAYLRQVVAACQQAVDDQQATDAPPPTTVDELVRASRLSDDFLLPSRPKDGKKLAKLAAKWQLPADETLRASMSSATLAGIYGWALTDRALYSRDLMEPLDRTALDNISDVEWVPEKKAFRVGEAHFVPTLPAVDDANREYFAGLLRALLVARA